MNIYDFLTGSKHMPSWHCVHESAWIGWVTIVLSVTIIIGYVKIALHWYKNIHGLKPGLEKTSLINMVNIFLFCGICGYFFLIVMMWYPIWEIRALFLAVLSFFTWAYAINTSKLKVIYQQLHDKVDLTHQLNEQVKINNDLKMQTHKLVGPIEELSDTVVFGIDNDTKPQTVDQINNIRAKINSLHARITELEKLNSKS